jgi:predicted  nucleic acid-binding Zn-ribbon protein
VTDGASPFADLLALQQLDTAIDQLLHQRANLPERAALAAVEADRAEVQRALAGVAARRTSLADQQNALERRLRELDARFADLAAKLPRTMVVREAEALMAEQRSVRERRSDVEDQELTLLEEDDGLDGEEAVHQARLGELDASGATASARLSAAEAAVDDQLADLRRRRDEVAATVPDELQARYDTLRKQLGGIAVAELHDGRCSGCHLRLSNMALERARSAPPDALVECEECGRLLVR